MFSVQVFRGLGLRASRVKFRRSVIAGMLFSGCPYISKLVPSEKNNFALSVEYVGSL